MFKKQEGHVLPNSYEIPVEGAEPKEQILKGTPSHKTELEVLDEQSSTSLQRGEVSKFDGMSSNAGTVINRHSNSLVEFGSSHTEII